MFNFYFSTLKTNSVGHLIYNMVKFSYEYNERKKIIIIVNKKKIVNLAVYNLIKSHYGSSKFFFVENTFYLFLFRQLIKISKIFPILNMYINNIETYHNRGVPKNEWQEYYSSASKNFGGYSLNHFNKLALFKKPIFTTTDDNIKYFEKWRIKNKINKKFILIFSRDQGYYNERNNHDIRNSEFNKLKKTIDYITKKKISVIRIGRDVKNKFNYTSNLFFDYSFNCKNNYDDVVELMMFRNCQFIIGNNTGLLAMQWLFDKKLFLYDYCPLGIRPQFKNCIYIPKRYYKNKVPVKYLKIPEEISLNENTEDLKKFGLTVEGNSESEIFEFIKHNFHKFDFCLTCDYRFIKWGYDSYMCNNWYNKNIELF